MIDNWIIAGSSMVLLIITAYYAWQTKQQVNVGTKAVEISAQSINEMKQQRYDAALPVINVEFVFSHDLPMVGQANHNVYYCYIKNAGSGTAIGLSVLLHGADQTRLKDRVLRVGALGPGQVYEARNTIRRISQADLVNSRAEYTTFETECKDIHNRIITTNGAVTSEGDSGVPLIVAVDGEIIAEHSKRW